MGDSFGPQEGSLSTQIRQLASLKNLYTGGDASFWHIIDVRDKFKFPLASPLQSLAESADTH